MQSVILESGTQGLSFLANLIHCSCPGAGMAADELQRAETYASAALRGSSHKSEAGLKLLGDIKLLRHATGPGPQQELQHQHPTGLDALFTRCPPLTWHLLALSVLLMPIHMALY